MKTLTHLDKPLKVFGVPFFEEKRTLERLPKALIEELKYSDRVGRRCPGARIGFRTDAPFFGDEDVEQCTIDRVHPNDLGFYRMASVVEPVLREIFDIRG